MAEISFVYTDTHGVITTRSVSAQSLVADGSGDVRWLKGFCRDSRAIRTFRLDQIEGASPDPAALDLPIRRWIAGVRKGRKTAPRERRMELLTEGAEVDRTKGRALSDLPDDAFRLTYSKVMNRRRVKDVIFCAISDDGKKVQIKDPFNGKIQPLETATILRAIVPATGEVIEGDDIDDLLAGLSSDN